VGTGINITTNSSTLTLEGGTISSNGSDALAALASNTKTLTIAGPGINVSTSVASFSNTGTLTINSGDSFTAANLTQLTGNTSKTLSAGTYVLGGDLYLTTSGISVTKNSATLTLEGGTILSNGSDALSGLAFNTKNLTIAGTGNNVSTTAASFSNTGTLTINSSDSFNAPALTQVSGNTLSAGTFVLAGNLNLTSVANITTNSAVLTLAGGTIFNTSTSTDALANLATNTNKLTLASNATFTTVGNFNNTGTFTINTGSTFRLGGSGMFTQSVGATTDDGSLSAPGAVNLNGGSLFGKGSITGALNSSSAAIITPGDSATATGILRDTGAYNQNGGTLDVSINGTTAGTKYDQLNPTTASLSGTLNISRPTNFVPGIGATFKIMNFASESGTFATVNGLSINNTEHFTLTYQPTDVLLTVVSGPVSPKGQHHAAPMSRNRNQQVINIRDSGQLLSMLDGAVPGPDGRLRVSRHDHRQAGNPDRANAGRMKADRAMADFQRMGERGMINPRLGRGTRAF
jgi:hypothetical protein